MISLLICLGPGRIGFKNLPGICHCSIFSSPRMKKLFEPVASPRLTWKMSLSRRSPLSAIVIVSGTASTCGTAAMFQAEQAHPSSAHRWDLRKRILCDAPAVVVFAKNHDCRGDQGICELNIGRTEAMYVEQCDLFAQIAAQSGTVINVHEFRGN